MSDTTTTATTTTAATGKVTQAREGLVVFSVSGANYEMHLVCPSYGGPLNTLVKGTIRVKARKVWTVPSGGLFIDPVFGRPRTIQGRIRSIDDRTMVLHAGGPIVVELPQDDTAFEMSNGPLAV